MAPTWDLDAASTSTGPDETDLDLLRALTTHARVEVAELTARLGLSQRRVRVRMRRLERTGLIRGYHAVAASHGIHASSETPATQTLAMLRVAAGPRLSAEDLLQISGVWRVYSLCSTWDFMIEFTDGGRSLLGEAPGDRGVVDLLGTRAEFEKLTVQCEHTGFARPHRESTIAPFLGLVYPAGEA